MANGSDRSIPGWAIGVAWGITFLVAYGSLGEYVALLIEGSDAAYLSRTPLVVTAGVVLLTIALTVRWAVGARGADAAVPASGRRRFLLGTGAVAGGLVGTIAAVLTRNRGWLVVTSPALAPDTPWKADAPRDEWSGAHVREYRRLGRTGVEVSDISLGSTRIKGQEGVRVVQTALDRGVNYIDTAPDYVEAGSEKAIGQAIQGRRDGLFLATKFCTPNGDLPAGTPVKDYIEVVNGSLKRLQTHYVDLVHIHACDRVDRLLDENAHEAFDRLKEQGKVRFLGFSSHTPNLENVAEAAIESDRFDVMMLAYHHGAWPRLSSLIERAHAEDVGVVAMKTLKGAHHHGLLDDRAQADSYTQAAFKWVLGNPAVSCLVISFRDLSNVDEYLHASGARLAAGEQAVLDEYDRRIAGRHCYAHCGACLDRCPEERPIDDVLRYRMYFESYGDEKEAMRQYARLDKQADVCLGCDAPCTGACPFGVQIQTRMLEAHRLLTLS